MAVTLAAGDARVEVDPSDGCRLTSLRVAGHELLVTEGEPPFGYGSFVMAPWAGRIRHGRARWAGRELRLDRWVDGHAIHGTVHDRPWRQVDDATWEVAVPEPWFGPARVRQHLDLRADRLTMHLEVHVEDGPVPATIGWHPWFRRELGGSRLELDVPAGWMLARDPDGIASDRRVPVPAGPWDDTFGALDWPVRLTWPGTLELEIDSDAPVAVVFTEPDHAVCVEPQSGPPDEVNRAPRLASAQEPLRLQTTWRWQAPPPQRAAGHRGR